MESRIRYDNQMLGMFIFLLGSSKIFFFIVYIRDLPTILGKENSVGKDRLQLIDI